MAGSAGGLPSPRSLPQDKDTLLEREEVVASFSKLNWSDYNRTGFLSPDEVSRAPFLPNHCPPLSPSGGTSSQLFASRCITGVHPEGGGRAAAGLCAGGGGGRVEAVGDAAQGAQGPE